MYQPETGREPWIDGCTPQSVPTPEAAKEMEILHLGFVRIRICSSMTYSAK